MARKRHSAGQINLPTKSTAPTTKNIVPVTLRECRQLIYNIFAKPKYKMLKITKRAYLKLMCYINLIGDYEISGFGRIQDGTITDVKILKQEVKPAYVECDENAVLDFIRSIPREQLAEWELDWHSHVNMSTNPSGTDWSNYEDMSVLRGYKQFPAMIINKKQNYTLINYISEDNSEDIELKITKEEITPEEIDEVYNEASNDIKANCTKAIEVKTNIYTYNKEKNTVKPTYPTYDEYSGNWWADYDKADDNDFVSYHCKSCGEQLLNSHELTTGLCEDCEEAVGKKEN